MKSKVALAPKDMSTYCPELWNRAYISQQNDQFAYKPCCYFRPTHFDSLQRFDSIYEDLNVKLEPVRTESANGSRPAGCSYCYDLEKSLESSPRKIAIEKYGTEVQLVSHLDLNLGNLCNLSCAICGPFNSSSWVPIAEKGWSKVDSVLKYKPKSRQVVDDPQLFLQLKTIQLQGGEIFLEPGYQKFFENLGKYRSYDDLDVMIFTNGTVRPSLEFIDILNKCGNVRIFFSIDDIEQRFEYQRRGSQWNNVVDNINWFVDHLYATYGFNTTYSLYNIYYLDELSYTLEDKWPHYNRNYSAFNTGMANCLAEYLDEKEYKLILEKYKDIPELSFLQNYLKIKAKPYTEFINYINKYDKITNTSYSFTHPEFWNLINT
jgi:MoaA/NifB/PqqE/SkfB family radical SAM enzyme